MSRAVRVRSQLRLRAEAFRYFHNNRREPEKISKLIYTDFRPDLCKRCQCRVGADDYVCLPAGVDECRFLLRSQCYVGRGFVNKARDLFTVVSAGGAIMRFLLEKHLAAHHLIFPAAVITTGNTPPVRFVLSQQELTTPSPVSCWERQHAPELAAISELFPSTRSRRIVLQSRGQ